MYEIKYEIIKKIGTLSTSASGWSKELNLISWNDREPRHDFDTGKVDFLSKAQVDLWNKRHIIYSCK